MRVFVLCPTQVGEFQAPFTGRIKHSGSRQLTLAQERVMRHIPLSNRVLILILYCPHAPPYEDAAYHHQLCSS